jgi:hypothetical protein
MSSDEKARRRDFVEAESMRMKRVWSFSSASFGLWSLQCDWKQADKQRCRQAHSHWFVRNSGNGFGDLGLIVVYRIPHRILNE